MAATAESTSQLSDCLDLSIFDQTICRHYIRTVLCFPFPDASLADAAVRQLGAGLRSTLHTWPYLAGRICLVAGEGPSGHVQVRYTASIPDLVDSGILEVRRHHDLHGAPSISYDHMTWAGMPCGLLPTQLVCSLPDSPDLSPDAPLSPPVLHVAVNFISGGLLVAVYVAHSVVDGVGLGHFLQVFAERVRSYPHPVATAPCLFNRSLITAHAHTVYRTRGISPCPEFKYTPANSVSTVQSRPVSPPHIVGKIFRFKASLLCSLRQTLGVCLADLTKPEDVPPSISMWDTLAALLWVYQIRCRFSGRYGINSNNGLLAATPLARPESSRFGFPINIRRRMDPPLPDSYIGNAVLYTFTELDLEILLSTGRSPITAKSRDGNTDSTVLKSLLPTIDEIPEQALAAAALSIRNANLAFDIDAIFARLAYLTQVPVPKTGSLVPNMIIAQNDPDHRSSGKSLPSQVDLSNSSPPDDRTDESHLYYSYYDFQQKVFREKAALWEQSSAPPPDVFTTSWKDIGANANFGIVGTNPTDGRPDFVRKPMSVFNEGGTIILPRRRAAKLDGNIKNGVLGVGARIGLEVDREGEPPYEVLLQLPEEHMEKLCWPTELGGWAERIID